jgi:NAD(P)-dependent dehydrogenase (short-subunit alcohol dehydrogenase family)
MAATTRGGATIAELQAAIGSDKTRWLHADLSSLDEVRAPAQQVTGGYDRLDALVDNAGIGTTLPGDGRRMESKVPRRCLSRLAREHPPHQGIDERRMPKSAN